MTNGHEALRADIRRLGHQLGAALTRQHGPRLLELVEEVRALTKEIRQKTIRPPVPNWANCWAVWICRRRSS